MFGKKTVDGIAASFHNMIADLEDVILHHEAEAERHRQIADSAISARLAHMDERARGSRLVVKIKELLS